MTARPERALPLPAAHRAPGLAFVHFGPHQQAADRLDVPESAHTLKAAAVIITAAAAFPANFTCTRPPCPALRTENKETAHEDD